MKAWLSTSRKNIAYHLLTGFVLLIFLMAFADKISIKESTIEVVIQGVSYKNTWLGNQRYVSFVTKEGSIGTVYPPEGVVYQQGDVIKVDVAKSVIFNRKRYGLSQ
ncbi:hypothetical protein [Spartinivicinus poritis]|uniref:hypothetical protein n=1 Tax=Spartinivicinus poritis TaxID=2994640 RepID=UPI00237D1C47|nr:hypothetical protein [Spartinivicinus sp. A2-2]